MIDMDGSYMRRCIELALQGIGHVAPNPMVGAVLVHSNRIIGEGWHRQYGQAHAEVNCLNSVAAADEGLISSSTLYVSLEPCAHFGKTPPCSELIIRKKIPRVCIGCRDPFEQVNGKGIEKLQQAGIETITGVLEAECMELNRRFFRFHQRKRPYIILKWVQTADNKIGHAPNPQHVTRLFITNPETNRLVHKWRSEETAIMVGTNTALQDDPSLDNRLWTGNSPVRMVLDKSLRLPPTLRLFNGEQPTIIFNGQKEAKEHNLHWLRLPQPGNIPQLLDACFKENIQSILVEGGSQLLRSFLDAGIWDEARVITNTAMTAGEGVEAPVLVLHPDKTDKIMSDRINYYTNKATL